MVELPILESQKIVDSGGLAYNHAVRREAPLAGDSQIMYECNLTKDAT